MHMYAPIYFLPLTRIPCVEEDAYCDESAATLAVKMKSFSGPRSSYKGGSSPTPDMPRHRMSPPTAILAEEAGYSSKPRGVSPSNLASTVRAWLCGHLGYLHEVMRMPLYFMI